MRLLLISSSFQGSGTYLQHAEAAIKNFLDACRTGSFVFVPYAGYDMDNYAAQAKAFFADLDPQLEKTFVSLHTVSEPRTFLESTDIKAVFCAGGNTFRLLHALQQKELVESLRQLAKKGTGYMGVSAGTNVACPTIMTTNDMPIVETNGLKALGLVDFQINPHYVPGSLTANHRGETREQRIAEYHEENTYPVIGLPETTWIEVYDDRITLAGNDNGLIFEKGGDGPQTWPAGTQLPIDTRLGLGVC